MQTNDPALTKTPITPKNANSNTPKHDTVSEVVAETREHNLNKNHHQQQDLTNAPIDSRASNTQRVGGTAIVNEDAANLVSKNRASHHDAIDSNTRVNKGTETLDNDVIHSEHVNDGDNPARQPDRRDQQGSTAFDEGINEDTVGSEAPKSEGINDMNRYASVDNAQSRILNPDEKD